MEVKFKIATWNLCLGLVNKKDYVDEIMNKEQLDVCCMQETEILPDYDHNLLSTRNYTLLIENNDHKSRSGMYIRNGTSYTRKETLEDKNAGLIIVDIKLKHNYRIINVYRSFNPPGGITQRAMFSKQLQLIKTAIEENQSVRPIVLGDFNLDENKKYLNDYSHRLYYEELIDTFDPLGLIQIVDFNTWSRLVNGVWRKSLLDHVYVKDITTVDNLEPNEVLTGDHILLTFTIEGNVNKPSISHKRNWIKYSKANLITEINKHTWNNDITTVQDLWNDYENKLSLISDMVAPITEYTSNESTISKQIPNIIRRKMRLRKRLLYKLKTRPDDDLKKRLKNLDTEIKQFHYTRLRKKIRKDIRPGNSKSLWRAVGIAKNMNTDELPETMYYNGVEIDNKELQEAFAEHFEEKISTLINNAVISQNVYNGSEKIRTNDKNFMTPDKVLESMKGLKVKNCEGCDLIPQRILADGIESLIDPFSKLFNQIYTQKTIPEQWKMAKITPVFKKGKKEEISNYRPISNLNSASKIFERLILIRINEIEQEMNVDLTGESQHGFKKNKSTTTASISIQMALAKALEQGHFALMASLDLSSAFDVVNINLLLKRMKIMGIPKDVLDLTEIWLRDRSYYITCKGRNSFIKKSNVGTIQGSILGPLLYAIFVSPLFDMTPFHAFADDNQIITSSHDINQIKTDMEAKLEIMTKWLRESGLIVNEQKTELCLFHKSPQAAIDIVINNVVVSSTNTINVLGITFDSMMKWDHQVSRAIKNSRKALHAIKLIKKNFSKDELKQLLTSNFYSILYYNSEVWHIPTIHSNLKQQLLAASSTGLRLLGSRCDVRISYDRLHNYNGRATPADMMKYKHSLQLYKNFNDNSQNETWLRLNFQQNYNQRNEFVIITDTSMNRIGKNLMINRLNLINGKIKYDWLNLSFESYKLKCKETFLTKTYK